MAVTLGGVERWTVGTDTTAAPTPVRTRIRGIDMARALAIVGMVMVHIGPQDTPAPGLAAAAYRASHGRASILFVVLAGVGVSLLAGDRSKSRVTSTSGRLAWRALLLLPAGVWLQTLDVNVAVILQYYAVYFVVAIAALRLPDRWLLAAAAACATVGPVVLLMLRRASPHLFGFGFPRWTDVPGVASDIVVTGYYPLIVWSAPLLLGMWVGRRDLRSPATAWRLLGGGAGAAAVGFVVSDALVARLGPASSIDWTRLAVTTPHSEMPLWLVTSTGIAVGVLGACLLLGRAAPRVVWPLVALGQLALTAYVAHLLVLDWRPAWLLRDAVVPAWLSVARFTVVAALLATAWRAVAARGPLEILLRAPWEAVPPPGGTARRP